MFCPTCGNKVDDGAAFCNKCGATIRQTTEPSTLEKGKAFTAKLKLPALPKINVADVVLALVLCLFYIGVSAFFMFVLNMEDTIVIETEYDRDVCAYLTLDQFLKVMKDGTEIFSPTIVSTALSVGMRAVIYYLPFLGVLAFVGTAIKKRISFHVGFSLVAILGAILMAVITPVTTRLVPEVTQALAIENALLYEDIKSVSSINLLIFAAVICVLNIAATVAVTIIIKRRGR